MKKRGYAADENRDVTELYRPWDATRFEGLSDLYSRAWDAWSEETRSSQARADGIPFNDSPVPAYAMSVYGPPGMVENQCMNSKYPSGRVLEKIHNIAFEEDYIVIEGPGNTRNEIGLDSDGRHVVTSPIFWPDDCTQALMNHISIINEYGTDNEEVFSCSITVLTQNVTAAAFGSYLNVNALNHGNRIAKHIPWVPLRGDIIQGLAACNTEKQNIHGFATRILKERHGPEPVSGIDHANTLVFLGVDFNADLLKLLSVFSTKTGTNAEQHNFCDVNISRGTNIKMPRIRRIVVVDPNGFTKTACVALFGKKGPFAGRRPVHSFTDLANPGRELEIVVFPIRLHEFWGLSSTPGMAEEFDGYVSDVSTRYLTFRSKLCEGLMKERRRQFVDADLKKIVDDICESIPAVRAVIADATGAAERNSAFKRDIQAHEAQDTVITRKYEIGGCDQTGCPLAGPVTYTCYCGGVYTTHLKGEPTNNVRIANDFLDSDEDSDDSSSSEDEKKKRKRTNSRSSPKRKKGRKK